jgi:hypothetical protein
MPRSADVLPAKFSIISCISLWNVGTWFFIALCLLRTAIDAPQSRRACIIYSFSFHRSIILTIGRYPFLGMGGLGS